MSPADIDFYDRTIETLDRIALGRMQDEKIRRLAKQLDASKFYVEKGEVAGLDIREIRDREGLKRLPFTTKSELVLEQAEHPPYGRLLTRPLSEYRHFHQTSGTTGR